MDRRREPRQPPRSASGRELSVSFEFFPPKTEAMEETLWESIERLAPLGPRFVSVTYGAGGSTRERTHAHGRAHPATRRALDAGRAPHLRRRDARRGRRRVARLSRRPASATSWRCAAIRPTASARAFAPHPGGYARRAPIWSRGIKRGRRFRDLGRAPIPRSIRRAPSLDADIDKLKRKVDAGADRAITQFFFDNDASSSASSSGRGRRHRHPDRARHPAGAQFQAGRGLRRALRRLGAGLAGARASTGSTTIPQTRALVAAAVAAEQVLDLVDRGVTDFHFYTMNRADLVYAICHLLGMRPGEAPSAPAGGVMVEFSVVQTIFLGCSGRGWE